ncbi:Tripartite tricarboxylate transporter TctA family protein [Nitrincola nitratireducens]|uniref:Tripartite tricarboxylate transporter TctA family protein n=1 Tax=Nitrincola nitratireducens TaxID=1229521 RepID=W9UZR3_9GAMM|nr:Tripartite tricarboxylate transporter TctA family protein [Nitrincola nitratireducens]
MDAILLGLNEIATFDVIVAIIIGALIGVTIGSIPGLEPAGVMAILLPISFSMEPWRVCRCCWVFMAALGTEVRSPLFY